MDGAVAQASIEKDHLRPVHPRGDIGPPADISETKRREVFLALKRALIDDKTLLSREEAAPIASRVVNG